MKAHEAGMHFVQLANAWYSEVIEGQELGHGESDQSIEDWTVDFQRYLADALRGRKGVDPEHPIFKITLADALIPSPGVTLSDEEAGVTRCAGGCGAAVFSDSLLCPACNATSKEEL